MSWTEVARVSCPLFTFGIRTVCLGCCALALLIATASILSLKPSMSTVSEFSPNLLHRERCATGLTPAEV